MSARMTAFVIIGVPAAEDPVVGAAVLAVAEPSVIERLVLTVDTGVLCVFTAAPGLNVLVPAMKLSPELTDFEAATAATLVSFGAAIHLLSVSLDPATHTFALAAGSIIAIIASMTHVAQAKRSDEKVSRVTKSGTSQILSYYVS